MMLRPRTDPKTKMATQKKKLRLILPGLMV